MGRTIPRYVDLDLTHITDSHLSERQESGDKLSAELLEAAIAMESRVGKEEGADVVKLALFVLSMVTRSDLHFALPQTSILLGHLLNDLQVGIMSAYKDLADEGNEKAQKFIDSINADPAVSSHYRKLGVRI